MLCKSYMMKSKDLTIVGLSFILLIQFGVSIKNSYHLNKLSKELNDTVQVVYWLSDRYEIAIDNLNSLNEYVDIQEKELKDYNDSSRLIKELR